MADAAEYGLMLWDGKSKGTINKGTTYNATQSLPGGGGAGGGTEYG